MMPTGVYERTQETRKHMSKSRKLWYKTHTSPIKGRKRSRVAIERQRAGLLRYYEHHVAPNKNIPHTETTKDKISKSMLEYWNSNDGLEKRKRRSQRMKKKKAGKISNSKKK